MITTVKVNGEELDACDVLADVVILHGRKAVDDGPTPGAASLTLYPSEMPGWRSGDTLELIHENGLAAFSGRITDQSLSHLQGTPLAALVVAATGSVARLGYRHVGDEPWPAESGTVRAERILTLAEVPHLIDGAADQVILPRDVDSRTALDLLTDLAKSTGAAVFDLPDGRVVYQPMAERARPVRPFRWMDWETDEEWQTIDPELTWAGIGEWHSADSEFPLDIPCDAVEWEPGWQVEESEVLNHVRIGYGVSTGEQEWTEQIDTASIATHGRRYQYTGTQLQNLTDAQDYASWLITVRGEERWRLGDVVVHLDLLDEATREAVLSLTCGDHITIDGMPLPAPAETAEGIVEGWTYQQWGLRGEMFDRIVLSVSALLESLAVPEWQDYPTEYLWSDHPAHIGWQDLVSIGA